MSDKTDFQVFQEMIDAGEDISMTPHFVSAHIVKRGGHITMGTDQETIMKLLSGEYTCALYVVKSDDFFKRRNTKP